MDKAAVIEVFRMLRGDGKPWIFVDTAVEIAASADMLVELLPSVIGRTKSKPAALPPVDLAQWMSFYRHHRDVQFAAFHAATGKSLVDVLAGCGREPTREQQEFLLRCFVGVPFPPTEHALRQMLDKRDVHSRSGQEILTEVMATPPGQFYWRVWFPCWALHQTFPAHLLRRARCGDDDALDDLLRLDKSVVADPVIAQRWHATMKYGSLRDRDRFKLAMARGPKKRITKKSIRIALSRMISQMARLCYCDVTTPEIKSLFDGIARIRLGVAADRQLPVGDNFRRGIHRASNWPALALPDS